MKREKNSVISYIKNTLFLICVIMSFQMTAQNYKVLIITGQNNHNWKVSSKAVEAIYNNSDMFTPTVIKTPKKGADMSSFNPDFKKYDLICLDYNGESWPEQVKKNFEKFVKKGGGLVVFHAADNSFPKWKAYNRMIGVGGWGGRTEKDGPKYYWEDGKIVKDKSPGKGGGHGRQSKFVVNSRKPKHPIMKGLPMAWLHTKDELYHSLKGPGKRMKILATAELPKNKRGSGRQEPVLMTIRYGRGRVFHSTLGHTGKEHETSTTISCAGFITTLLRGSEWVVTGDVTQEVSFDFPTETTTKTWLDLKVPDSK